MSVHIIIDGYNLIRQSRDLSLIERDDIQNGRRALIDMLVAYKRIKPHKISVVFDGIDAPAYSTHQDRVSGIAVTFSRSGESADTVIKRMVAREKHRALVVSSDREIVDYAASKGAAAISSPDFEAKIAMAGAMDAKGLRDEEDSGWVPTTRKKGPRRRLSKRQRRNRMKIKKL